MKVGLRHVVVVLAWTVLAFVPLAASAQAAASAPTATPQTYAVLSLIGDEFTVITRRDSTGSRLDVNDRRVFPVAEAVFDQVAIDAAERALKQARPAAGVLRFSIRDARLFKLQERLLVDAADSRDVREALGKLLRENQATHLLLVTKRRDDAAFKIRDGTTGVGKIAGLGFYVDPTTPLMHTNTGEHANGFFSPYAYMEVTLVDVATMRTSRSVPALESSMTTDTAATQTFRAWDAMTGQQKVDALERSIRRGVGAAVARVLVD